MQLVKFIAKADIRSFLKSKSGLLISSIFYANNNSYLVIDGLELLPPPNSNLIFFKQYSASPIETIILQWGCAEILNDLVFIQFETNSTLVANGRQLIYNNQTIIRSFDYLAEIFAILNYNANSFSDGGKYNSIDLACERIEELVNNGADVIDIGVESTGYDAKPIEATHEIELLQDLIPEVITLKQQYNFKLSIDTYHAQTVTWLNDYAIDIINDVSGNLPIAQVKQIIADSKKYVLMHSLVVPSQRDIILPLEDNPLDKIYAWLEQKLDVLSDNGIDCRAVIFDWGIGFGKNAAQSWFLMNNLREFNNFPCETLLGHSRKSLFNHIGISQPQERDLLTAVSAAALINQVDYFRLHDLTLLRQIYPVLHQLKQSRL